MRHKRRTFSKTVEQSRIESFYNDVTEDFKSLKIISLLCYNINVHSQQKDNIIITITINNDFKNFIIFIINSSINLK